MSLRRYVIFVLVLVSPGYGQKPNLEILGRRQDVYVAGFFPFGKGVEQSGTGRGVMPSVKLALDHVNEHTGVLRNYRLHMWWNDTECNAAVGVKSFFDMMSSGPHKLMLFGAACTHVTDPIAKASKHWHLTQLSYADTHPMFTKDSFPNFFRIVPSENAFNLPRLALLKHFNWTRVGTIYQNEPRYSLAHNRLVADLDDHGFQIVETQSFATEVKTALSKLKDKDVRIILGNFNETWAAKVFCEAYKLDMYGRSYQWLIMGAYSENWWEKISQCKQEELGKALDAAILTDLLPLSTTGDITISGITASEYQVEYDRRRGSEYSRFHGYTYDGIWAVALAIQHVATRARAMRKERGVADFRYRDPLWEALFLDALKNVSFEGVTGPVRFYDNERKASILLKQFQGLEKGEVKVGEYCSELSRLEFSTGLPFRWIGRIPPKDRTLHIIERSQVDITIYAVLASCAVMGILLATLFLGMNIHYRNQRYIKMSSPHLNNLIIIGCMLTYLSVIFLGLDSGLSSIAAFPYICTARAWLLMAGFSLAFGAMFSKTWRVHSIFTDVKLNKKVIKDYQLFMVVGVLLCIDLAIMTTWQVSDPFYRATKQMEPYPHPSSEDTLIIRENEYCQSEQMTIFIGVIYAYKGLLMIFGAFLAWETRHVSIPALNDSKHVGLSVYNVVIMCVMGAAIALVLSDHKDALFMLISVFIIFCTTATLCLVFVPKLLELRRNGQPGGTDKGRIRATLRPASKGHDCRSPGPELERRLKELRTFNSRYKRTLQAKENELQMLLGKLGTDISQLDGKDKSPKNIRLNVPPTLISKDSGSQLESSDITSLCSLTASQGIDEVYNPADRTKSTTPTSQTEPTVRFAAPESEIQKPEPTAPKKEPVTKNVSFKNHTESANNVVAVMQPAGVRPVPEKDQLAKSPYGWKVEPIEEPPYQIQKIAPREMEPKPPVKPQEVVAAPVARSHRRMSSISQSAMISDLMHVAIDQDDLDNHNLLDQKALDTESDSDYSHSLSRKDLPPDKYQAGNYPDIIDTHDSDYSTLERARLSQRRDSEKRKNNFIVAQSDLWDTNTFTYAQAKHTASHHHSPIQRSVSEKQRHSSQSGTPTRHTSSREEPRSYSGERRSSNASTHESQQSSGTHRSSRESLSSTKRGSSAATPEGYRDADTLRAHERPSRQYQQQRRGSEFPQPVSAPVAQNQRRRQSSAQVRMTSDDRTTSSSDADRSTAVVSQRHVPRGEDNVSELMSERPQQLHIASQQRSSQRHHQSTPDVANARHHKRSPGRNGDPSKHGRQYQYQKGDEKHPSKYERNRRQQHQVQSDSSAQGKQHDGTRKMYTASSESELFEYAILPIFQKLLTERHKSQPQGLNLTYGVSCPNISIKCDIVEYL